MRGAISTSRARRQGAVDAAALDREIERRVNAHRRWLGLRPLEPDPALAAAARHHSHRMRNLGFFAHTDPHDGTDSLHRVGAVDRRAWTVLAENLAAGTESAEQIVRGWLESPGHRANIENPDVTHFGTATSLGGELLAYTTQVYGWPCADVGRALAALWQDFSRRVSRGLRRRRAAPARRWR